MWEAVAAALQEPSASKREGTGRQQAKGRVLKPFSQLGRCIKYWQKALIAKCVCLFIYWMGCAQAALPLSGGNGSYHRKRDWSQLAFTADAAPPDPSSRAVCSARTSPHTLPHIAVLILFMFQSLRNKKDSGSLAKRPEAPFLPVDSHSHQQRHRRGPVPFLS